MKKAITIFFALVMVLSLTACGAKLSSGDLIGVWSGAWEYDGHNFNTSIEFERDGTYMQVTYKDNSLSSIKDGSYTIDGREVNCKGNDNSGTATYKYSDGKLENNGHSLSKE